MKKFILLLIVPFLGFSQIEEGSYTAKYMGIAELEDGEYVILEEDWVDVAFYFAKEYFTVSFDGETEKTWYEYLGYDINEGCPGCDVYQGEDGGELWIDYEGEEFLFYDEPNSRNEFQTLIYFRKIEKN